MFNTLYKKCLNLAAHKSSKYYLAAVSFIESSFFPIPPDVMVIPMVISKKEDFLKIFLITTLFSVLGGILGYFIGAFFFDIGMQVMNLYGYEDKLINLKNDLPEAYVFQVKQPGVLKYTNKYSPYMTFKVICKVPNEIYKKLEARRASMWKLLERDFKEIEKLV